MKYCVSRYDAKHCPGRMQTVNDVVLIPSLRIHTHAPDARSLTVNSVVATLRQEAATGKSTQDIISSACGKVKGAVKAAMPKISNMSRNIRRVKQKRNIAPVAPKRLRDLILNGDFTTTTNKENFLFYDSGASDRRIVIYATEANLNFLKECEEWYLDGTFRICPPLFSQIYTIHGKSPKHVV